MEAAEVRQIPLDRRICYIGEGRIDIRPSRGALLGPLIGLGIGVSLLVVVALFLNKLPAAALAALLIPALIITPLTAMGAVYSIAGSHILLESKKQSARFQQGMMGLGLGTVELVPFWKIDRILLEDYDLGETYVRGAPSPLDLVAWEVVLVKSSGKRLSIGQVIVPDEDELVEEGFNRALDVAEAVSQLVGKPLEITAAVEEEIGERQGAS
ncbi:MAG TPA: hypothetical protein VNL15_01235 [Dehalococcoidia bacterium]|nr:hypothetical protein [Dehalococcoidia bacterium]